LSAEPYGIRRAIAGGLSVACALASAACGGSSAAEETSNSDSARMAATGPTAAPSPAAAPYRVARYPSPHDEDVAFVSEVLELESVDPLLRRAGSMAEIAALLADEGRATCAAYSRDDLGSVVSRVAGRLGADSIDATAFVTAAAGVYCPQALGRISGGSAMEGGIEFVDVAPQCVTEPPVSFRVDSLELYGSSTAHWSFTARNTGSHAVVLRVEERVSAPGYEGTWTTPAYVTPDTVFESPLFLSAGESRTGSGMTGGIYRWDRVEHRIVEWLPIDCAVELDQTAG
jgi:hypothetical protein